MKKVILVLILFINALFTAFSQNSGSIDLILILDTSQEMSAYYEKVSDYITGAFLKEFLRVGDTFHLICFSSKQRVDVARRIQERGDIETIIGRMFLQYPIEKGNDYQGVLNFAQDYVSSLPQRAKKIVIVSSGGSQLDNAVNAVRQNFTSRNITVNVVQVNQEQSLANPPSSNRPASTQQASDNKTGAVAQTGTQSTGKIDDSAVTERIQGASPNAASDSGEKSVLGSAAPDAKSGSNETAIKDGFDAASGQKNADAVTAAMDGSDTPVGARDSPVSGTAANANKDDNLSPGTASGSQNQETSKDNQASDKNVEAVQDKNAARPPPAKEGAAFSIPLFAGLAIFALIVLILIVILIARRLRSSPNRVIAGAAAYSKEKNEDVKFEDHSKELAKYAASQPTRRTTPYQDKPVRNGNSKTEINFTGPILLNLFVEDQNTAIGRRNIHSLKSGYSLTLGGGKSDFYIFLVPVPANIGELHRDGSRLTFVPKKPKYFPDIGSNEVKDCLNKTIRIISDRNYEIRFRFELWEDPLIELNKLMTSFRIPG